MYERESRRLCVCVCFKEGVTEKGTVSKVEYYTLHCKLQIGSYYSSWHMLKKKKKKKKETLKKKKNQKNK